MAGIISPVVQSGLPEHQDSAQYRAGRFHNLVAGLSGVAILKVRRSAPSSRTAIRPWWSG